MIASTVASGRASRSAATAADAAVRMAVIDVPSMIATGVPLCSSHTTMSPWCDGTSVPWLPAKTVTAFTTSPTPAR